MSFLFHPQRATRLVQQKAMDPDQLGLMDVIGAVLKLSMAEGYTGYHRELQKVVADQLANALMELGKNSSASASARGMAILGLQGLMSGPTADMDSDADRAFYTSLGLRINRYIQNPGEEKTVNALTPPDGSPIGSDARYFGMGPRIYCTFHEH